MNLRLKTLCAFLLLFTFVVNAQYKQVNDIPYAEPSANAYAQEQWHVRLITF